MVSPVTIAVLAVIVAIVYWKVFRRDPRENSVFKGGKSLQSIPGPEGKPILGVIGDFEGDCFHRYVYDLHVKYGPVVRIALGPSTWLSVADPSWVSEILHDKRKAFTNSDVFRNVFGFYFPNSVICVEGDEWKVHRRIVHSAITAMKPAKWLPVVKKVAERRLDPVLESAATDGHAVDVEDAVGSTLFESFLRFGYGIAEPDTDQGKEEEMQQYENAKVISGSLSIRSMLPVRALWYLPTEYNRRVDASYQGMKEYVTRVVNARKEYLDRHPADASDNLLDGLIIASQSERVSDAAVADNVMTLFFAAYDTTSNTFAAMMSHLALNPTCQERLRNDLRAWDRNTAGDVTLLADEVPYLDWCIYESQRLHAAAFAFARTVTEPVQVAGINMPTGTYCLINNMFMGRHAKQFELKDSGLIKADSSALIRPSNVPDGDDAHGFRPERWADDNLRKRVNLEYAFNPFGAGGRMCPGSKLALNEMRVMAANMLMQYCFKPDPENPIDYTCRLAMGPKDGGWVLVQRVTPADGA
eukprot:Clim_evm59s201 gene=Clim_evmTU59s201